MSSRFDRTAMAARAAALARFNEWEARQSSTLSAADAVAGIGFLYDQLPPESRTRPVDVSGIQAMHRALAVLSRR